MEMGYHVTLMCDATTAFSAAGIHAAHEVNGPMFAQAILTTDELLPQLGWSRSDRLDARRMADTQDSRPERTPGSHTLDEEGFQL